jgi:hypothetical protein
MLMLVSVALLVVVAVLFFRDRNQSSEPVPPTAVPGRNQAIDVLNALRANDLDAEFGTQGSDVRSAMLERPGQTVELPDGTVYIFIYPDFGARDDATLDVLIEDVDLTDVGGNEIELTDDAYLFTNSNVAVVVISPDTETVGKVEEAVASLT